MADVQNWNKEKEAEYRFRQEDKLRLANLAREREEAAQKAKDEADRIKAE